LEATVRADAQRNRERIVAAALDLCTARGTSVSMEEIARAAGLGVGTLYRHFPDRQALVEHIAVVALEELLAFSRAAVADEAPRVDVLRRIAARCTELPLAITRSFGAPPGPCVDMAREHDRLLERLVSQAQADGSVRRDIPPRQVVELLHVAICRPGVRPGDHLVTVVLDGLK
jgi:AcrR family transcriptional regulator